MSRIAEAMYRAGATAPPAEPFSEDDHPWSRELVDVPMPPAERVDAPLPGLDNKAKTDARYESASHDVVAAIEPFNRVVEQLHVLRSQLLRCWFNGDRGHKALAITSADRRDGRSFIAAKLAVVFAQSGARTVLIDADLRHGCQARLFKLEESVEDASPIRRAGLSNMLAGQARHEGVVVSGVMRNLSVVPAGSAAPNPHELLSRPAFGKLLNDLAIDSDVILIDTPAARHYADAQILASRAGAAVVLARKDLTSASDLLRLARSLQQSGVELVGSVFNHV